MEKQQLFIVHLEPLDERYTASWHRNLPNEFRQAAYDVVEIDGTPLVENDIQIGTFLDINSTVHWKAAQIQQIAKLFQNKQVKNGAIFFFSDIEFWGLEQVRLLADMNNVKVYLTGFLHAASYTKDDAFAIAAPYQQYTEIGWLAALDQIYVGSEYHKQAVIDRRLTPIIFNKKKEEQLASKIRVTKNPMFPSDYKLKGLKKEKRMLLTNRFDAEKAPDATLRLFRELKRTHADWKFIVCTSRKTFRSNKEYLIELARNLERTHVIEIKYGLSKEYYHEELERAAIVVSHSPEENYGLCVAESIIYGCMPLLRDNASHPEFVNNDRRYLFKHFDLAGPHASNDVEKAEALMKRFEQGESSDLTFDWNGMKNIIINMRELR